MIHFWILPACLAAPEMHLGATLWALPVLSDIDESLAGDRQDWWPDFPSHGLSAERHLSGAYYSGLALVGAAASCCRPKDIGEAAFFNEQTSLTNRKLYCRVLKSPT